MKKLKMVIVIFLLWFSFLTFTLDKLYKREINESTAKVIPVVILSEGEITIISSGNIEDFIKMHPNYTFLIPKEQENYLQNKLEASHPNINASWTFNVKYIAKDLQFIEVECFGDNRTVGYYEATDKTISPKFYKSYGVDFAFLAFGISLVLTKISWSVKSIIYWVLTLFQSSN